MNDFAQDVWHQLREKRLWPLAVLLAVALVAIPALLTKSAAQPPAPDPAAFTETEDTRVAVTRDETAAASTGTGSALDEFSEGDPFTPPARIARGPADGEAPSTPAGPSDGAGGSTGGGGGGDVDAPVDSPGTPVAAPPTTRTETAEYEYVADVAFWTGDRRRDRRGLRKLDMLPNQSAPVLIFMGTSGQGGNAVFLVDSTLQATGEGRCDPSPANCAYVHLGPGSEHAFTTDAGDSYRLRVKEIRRVKVRAGASAASPRARSSEGAAVRRFQLPSLADLVEVSTTTTGTSPSSIGGGGR